jgi:1,2-diacylglycerol-3-alpha-glucose alpha-1,2-galactosyltransferase
LTKEKFIPRISLVLINLISDTEYSAKDHGVHTAYLNYAAMLEENNQKVVKNSFKKADVTSIHTAGPIGLFKLLTSKPTVVTAHIIPDSFVGSLIGVKYWYGLLKWYLTFFYSRANLVLAVSPKVENELIKMGVKSKIKLFPNPINTKIFKRDFEAQSREREKLGISKDDFVVLGAGQIQTRKGIADFIETARKLPNIKFVWIGGQPFKTITEVDKKLSEEIKKKPDNVLLPGVFGYNEMPAIYNTADVFMLPSFQENAPMAVIEAASCGLPVVLRDLPEYKMLYKNGFYIGAKDNDFTGVIKRLYEDKKYYNENVIEAKKLSLEFSFKTLGPLLIKNYQSLI